MMSTISISFRVLLRYQVPVLLEQFRFWRQYFAEVILEQTSVDYWHATVNDLFCHWLGFNGNRAVERSSTQGRQWRRPRWHSHWCLRLWSQTSGITLSTCRCILTATFCIQSEERQVGLRTSSWTPISLSIRNRNSWYLVSRHIFWRCLDIQMLSSLSLVFSKLQNF